MLLNGFKTIRLKKIKGHRLRRSIRSNIRCLIERQKLYEAIDEKSNVINAVIVKYKIDYNEVGDAVLILRFVKSGRPTDNQLINLKDPLETIFDRDCSEPYKARTYIDYHLILETYESEDEDLAYMGMMIRD